MSHACWQAALVAASWSSAAGHVDRRIPPGGTLPPQNTAVRVAACSQCTVPTWPLVAIRCRKNSPF